MGRACRILTFAASVLAPLVAVLNAYGDGKFFGGRVAGPTIPSQRAVIVHREGVQTLIVESDVTGVAGEVGWILPLPAEPNAIEVATPGTLETLTTLLQPRLSGRSDASAFRLFAVLIVLAAVVFIVTYRLRRRDPQRAATAFVTAIVAGLLPLSCIMLLLPALATARGSRPGIEALSTQRVGAYDVTILRAESVDAVCAWLHDHGFTCDDAAPGAFDAYIADGWVFAAMRLATAGGDALTPHPLQVTFPVAAPIYPMRLTGAGASEPLALDLFVIADGTAHADAMRIWHADRYVLHAAHPHGITSERTTVLDAQSLRATVGHPGIVPLGWNGCTITRLHGVLRPPQMQADLPIALSEHIAQRATVYSAQAARGRAYFVASIAFALIAPAMVVWAVRRRSRGRPVRAVVGVLAVLVPLASGLVTYVLAEVVPVESASLRERYASHLVANALWDESILAHARPIHDVGTLETFILEQAGAAPEHPPSWWQRDVPGGCVIEPDGDTGWRATLYDASAAPAIVHVKRDRPDGPTPRPATD